jgi:cytochrome c-type biogenesis protein CcmH
MTSFFQIGLCLFLLFSSGVYADEADSLHFATLAQSQQYHLLLKELRCVTCPNQSLNDSFMPIAMGMKTEIYKQIQENKSSQEIKNYFISRYGKSILYQPPIDRTTFILWSSPLLLFLMMLVLWRRYIKSSVTHVA